jgi:hypothetical protein
VVSEQPRPGDKVRVTYEGVVTESGIAAFRLDLGNGAGYTHAISANDPHVEVVERADDPGRDLVGTIRGDRYVRLTVNHGCDWWDLQGEDRWISVKDVTGRVTGAVPGTPAAVKNSACDDYDPKGELGGVVYTVCLNCGFGEAAHGKPGAPPRMTERRTGQPEPVSREELASFCGELLDQSADEWAFAAALDDRYTITHKPGADGAE